MKKIQLKFDSNKIVIKPIRSDNGIGACTLPWSRSIETINQVARWPDLTSCNYFLWIYLKPTRIKIRPPNSEVLKAAIIKKITVILREITERVIQNFRFCLTSSINNGDHYTPDIILHTQIANSILHTTQKINQHISMFLCI